MKNGIFQKEAKFMMGLYISLPVIAIIAAILIPPLMEHAACDNTIVSVNASPDGLKKAVVFARDCGATTDFSTQVSILLFKKELPNESGNAFVADSDHGKAETGKWGGPNVVVLWQDNNNIIVKYADKARVFKKQETIAGVRISYSEGISAANKEDSPDQKAVR